MTHVTFHIEGPFTPQTMPMAAMADYMVELATLLGFSESVHFEAARPGSVNIVALVDDPVRLAVRKRVTEREGDVQRSIEKLNAMLAKDDAVGELAIDDPDERVVVQFPGKNRPAETDFGLIRQDGVLEGRITSVGGRDDTKHIHLRDGDRFYSECIANTEIAQQLGRYLFGPTIRLIGQGSWQLTDGEWELKRFRIQSYVILDETPLDDLVAKLRAVPGNHWDEVDDPVATVLDERGQSDTH